MNEKDKVRETMGQGGKDVNNLPFVEYHRPPGATGHEPLDSETRERRAVVKKLLQTVGGTKKPTRMSFVMDESEGNFHSERLAGAVDVNAVVVEMNYKLPRDCSIKGATIVDALDTLYIMEMFEEFDAATDWVEKNLDFNVNAEVSVFEVNIRFVGGLLSAYYLSGKEDWFETLVILERNVADRWTCGSVSSNAAVLKKKQLKLRWYHSEMSKNIAGAENKQTGCIDTCYHNTICIFNVLPGQKAEKQKLNIYYGNEGNVAPGSELEVWRGASVQP
ncbi:Mannosyl-oligosaccharide 1 [Nibea albiflora]|uniref:Mannosyl-oligosaccharide 1 n=1 Tax=Nibea albiflora TaxID=240163 RepID=A0ACB7FAE7_NIBAL|nr:Mannosyl-oligosaccharide 1 [Nibea albiflora]